MPSTFFQTVFSGINTQTPRWVEIWALATMLRALHYQNNAQFAAWNSWAGGSGQWHSPSIGPLRSNQLIFNDNRSAIVFFEGTRTPAQIWKQALGAIPTLDPLTRFQCNGFQLWALNEEYPSMIARLYAIPGLERIIVVGHSLGAAMGNLFCHRIQRSFPWTVSAFYSFGQPRSFATRTAIADTFPYFRIINDTDPVPGLPPRGASTPVELVYPNFPGIFNTYRHAVEAWILGPHGLVGHRDNLDTNDIWAQIPATLLTEGDFATVLQRNHIVRVYLDRLKFLTGGQADHSYYAPIRAINAAIDAIEFGGPAPGPVLVGVPSAGTFAHPRVTIPDGPGLPTVPPGVVGTQVEQRTVAHNFFSFGGRDIVAKTFQSRDRRILQKCRQLLGAVVARDARVADPRPTQTLSNRIIMFPPAGASNLKGQLEAVLAQVETLLAQVNP